MNITIISVGKFKESYWREAAAEYEKRLGPYIKLTIHELIEESFGKDDPAEITKAKEAEKILKHIPDRSFVIALDEHGTEFSSVGFLEFLDKKTADGTHVVFVIGGPRGLHAAILERADATISFSQLTFPHQMMRVFLLEQLYRAITIMHGKSYHY